MIALASLGAVILRAWTTQLISFSLAGFLTTFYYVLFRAPDLALTQILIETATLVLVLLLLGRFPRACELGVRDSHPTRLSRVLKLLVALATGGTMTLLLAAVTGQPHPSPIGPAFLAASQPLAHGDNAVNTLLVDFRGLDTLLEITVLLIATLGCLGLFLRYRRTPEEWRAGEKGPPASVSKPLRFPMNRLDSPILRAVARITFFLVNVFAIYLLLRGHHLPGGGFIAGLATSISMVMLLLALGVDALPGILRVEPVSLAVAGLALAAFTAMAPVLRGGEFLRHAHAGITLPLLGTIEVGTPLLFDTGVFLLVIGVTCKMIIVLARSTLGEPALGWRERQRFAAPVETPIEEDAPSRGGRNPDARPEEGSPWPLIRSCWSACSSPAAPTCCCSAVLCGSSSVS